ncbi:MAG TPA: DUF4383 domain-containing protein [Micromonospora sp.]|nr:DUF4383 domain-containing protein [Micromonospora sp.]
MAHNPVNHPARPIYRALGGLIGLYLVIFGVFGVIEAAGSELFAQDDLRILGQGANLGSSLLLGGLGLLVLVGLVIGRNLDVRINKSLGYAFMALGLVALGIERTEANILNFTVATCVVTMLLGVVLLTAGMYSKVGTEDEVHAWKEACLRL